MTENPYCTPTTIALEHQAYWEGYERGRRMAQVYDRSTLLLIVVVGMPAFFFIGVLLGRHF